MKRSKRKLRITREGWSYIFILCFIIVGSVLQQINLLVMLAGLMIAPLLINWRVAMNTIFQLDLQRKLPSFAHAGQTVVVEWVTKNTRQLLPTWGVKITDTIRRSDIDKKKATKVDIVVSQVSPGEESFTSFRCHFGQRGVYTFGPSIVSSKFPLGLMRAWYRELNEETFVVAPRLGVLTEAWSRKMTSAAVGLKSSSKRKGFSQDEFYALRPWRSGDSKKWIHWRSSAKQGQPIVKQFDQQTDRDYAIVLDLFGPEVQQASDMETSELAVSFAASVVANIRQKVKGNIAIGICGTSCKTFRDRVTPELTSAVMLELAEAQTANENQLVTCINEIGQSISASAPVIVISTRSQQEAIEHYARLDDSLLEETQLATWVQVGTDEFEQLFRLSPSTGIEQILNDESESEVRTPLIAAQ